MEFTWNVVQLVVFQIHITQSHTEDHVRSIPYVVIWYYMVYEIVVLW